MNANIFFDTNVILYSYSILNNQKSLISKNLINSTQSIISTQVLQEMCNVLIKKFNLDMTSISNALSEMELNFDVRINTTETIRNALKIHFKYLYSYYDSLIISSALENKCSVLYSEDLQHNQKIENTLTILNPFI
ncbi:PIN domain-containing protein [Hanamia caeni]|jgi:predicted nucleic acid-binding protein|uniref:PIN domain-containing protein n=1 Tax=Hanamia caeni TaxID=2294116 RepID=A0A3M9N6T8_9BACT|nr:PIN domain-containing protein [Hanamia caeni]RNI33479.1 PIN domain-containing protein [Hanamia caeni]